MFGPHSSRWQCSSPLEATTANRTESAKVRLPSPHRTRPDCDLESKAIGRPLECRPSLPESPARRAERTKRPVDRKHLHRQPIECRTLESVNPAVIELFDGSLVTAPPSSSSDPIERDGREMRR
jgi:hypothetical protein